MRNIGILLCICVVGVLYIGKPFIGRPLVPGVPAPTRAPRSNDMKLTSPAFEDYGKIPKAYTCDGGKKNPPLTFTGVPKDAKSLAIIIDDPDAPSGTFNHWLIWNIDPTISEILFGVLPAGSQQGTTTAGREGYVPPCPPVGQHRYFITLFALDAQIGLDGKAKKSDLESAMAGHIIVQTQLIGVYSR